MNFKQISGYLGYPFQLKCMNNNYNQHAKICVVNVLLHKFLTILNTFYVVKDIKLEEDDHYAAIGAALSQLHMLCEKICSSTITLRSLSNVKNKEAQFKILCDAASSDNQDMCMTFSKVKPHLDECYRAQSLFADHRNQISTLLEFCNDISHGIQLKYSL